MGREIAVRPYLNRGPGDGNTQMSWPRKTRRCGTGCPASARSACASTGACDRGSRAMMDLRKPSS